MNEEISEGMSLNKNNSDRFHLVKLIEEASEVIKASCKIVNHGAAPTVKDKTYRNIDDLEREIGDLLAHIEFLTDSKYINKGNIEKNKREKRKFLIEKYYLV